MGGAAATAVVEMAVAATAAAATAMAVAATAMAEAMAVAAGAMAVAAAAAVTVATATTAVVARADKQPEKQPDGLCREATVLAGPFPGFPLAALTAATAVSHSDTLAIGVRPALVHVAPLVVRTT
eukprot:scaffold42518_cov63-Phaeocystis_antarctica.AAC.4